MRGQGKRAAVCGIIGALLLLLTGCEGDLLPKARDITTVELMQVIALDKGEGGNLIVTAASGTHSGGQSGEPKPPVVLKGESSTVFGACMSIQSEGNGYASFGHVEQCVLSAKATEQSMSSLLDFLERDPEMRMEAHLYVTEQDPAAELLTEVDEKEQSAAERLEAIGRELTIESFGWPVTVRDFMIDMEENSCGLLPVLKLVEEEKKKTIRCESMGWIQNGDYQGTLPPEQARAAAILEGKLDTGGIELHLSDGSVAGLKLTQANCTLDPVWSGGRLTGISIHVDAKADLAELQGPADLYSGAVQKELSQGMERQLKGDVQELLALSQKEEADFLHMERKLRVKSPAKAGEMEEHWEEWFPELNMSVEVHGVIERSYDLNRQEAAA